MVDSLLRLRYPAGKIFNSEPQHRKRREVSHNAYHHHDHEPSQAMPHVALRPVRHHIQHARPIESDRPACFSGPINARFINCVITSVTMAILTGVLMSCRE